jgi:hypothetical protein
LKPKYASFLPGVPPCLKAGFYQFSANGYAGALQPINWQQCMCLPDIPNPTGMIVYVEAGQTWQATPFYTPDFGWTLNTPAGQINPNLNILTGVQNGDGADTSTTPERAESTPSSPVKTGPQTIAEGFGTYGGVGGWNSVTLGSNLPFYLTMLGFANEIAQQTLMADAAETSEEFASLTLSQLAVPSAGVPRWAEWFCASPPVGSSYQFGGTGALKLGVYAWDYNGYKTPKGNINSQFQQSLPPAPGATGFYMIMKPRVSVNLTMGVNEYVNTSIQTDVGEINLLAGILSGLAPSHP